MLSVQATLNAYLAAALVVAVTCLWVKVTEKRP